jgi:N-methylhydantoinase A/oxoprolinase/acetone carboxylase beta subunit
MKDFAWNEGGFEYDGGTEISPINEEEVRAAVRSDISNGITSFVISGVFSPVNASQEEQVGCIVEDEIQKTARSTGLLALSSLLGL